ncbi:hypothetical protein OAC06_05645 [Alphaproteobacteria bacterium]|nr:hypothetical protein [Alphaproteobacteria bacterium]
MRPFLIIYLLLFFTSLEAKEFDKCKDEYNSFETSKCLKKLKSKLINLELSLEVFDTKNKLYTNKNIFLSICEYSITSHKYSGRDGTIEIILNPKYLKNCESLISIDIISEYGQCKEGNYAKANWNSLDMNKLIYFSCSK